jgi:Ca2+-binding EF-hand superfamily protein
MKNSLLAATLLGSITFVAVARSADPASGTDDKAAKRAAQFPKLDKNADGALSKEEFLDRKSLKDDPGAAEKAYKTFVKYDSNGDGALSQEKFVGRGGKGGTAADGEEGRD